MILIDLFLLIVFLSMAKVIGEKTLTAGKVGRGVIDVPFYFELGIGLAVISYAVFLLGVTAGLKGIYFKIAGIVLLAVWYKEILRAALEGAAAFREIAAERGDTFNRLLLVLLLVCVIFGVFFNYAPPNGEDELVYHLNIPQKYLLHGKIFNMPENLPSYFFLTLDFLYIPLMAIKSVFAAKLLSFAFVVMDMTLVYLFTREFVGKRYALLAAVLFYTTPMTIGMAGIGKIDGGVVFYALLALWSFLKYSRAELKAENTWFVLFTASSGILMVSKSTGPYFVASFMIMLAAVLIVKKRKVAGTIKIIAAYGLTTSLFMLPWLVRNMFWTGNPFYPVKIFPGLPYAEQFYDVLKMIKTIPAMALIKSYFFDILMGTGYVIAAFLPLYLILKKKNFTINVLLVYAGLIISILYASGYGANVCRYTYCCFAIFAITSAYVIVTLSDSDPGLKRLIAATVLAMTLVPGVSMSVYFGAKRIPFVLGLQSAEQYLQKEYKWEGWTVVKWAAGNIPQTAKICYMGEVDTLGYYYNQPMVVANCPSILRYSLGEAKAYLKTNNIEYLILRGDKYTEKNGVLYHSLPFMNVYWFKGTSIDQEFPLVFSSGATRVYKVS